jgi:hypothetical protein
MEEQQAREPWSLLPFIGNPDFSRIQRYLFHPGLPSGVDTSHAKQRRQFSCWAHLASYAPAAGVTMKKFLWEKLSTSRLRKRHTAVNVRKDGSLHTGTSDGPLVDSTTVSQVWSSTDNLKNDSLCVNDEELDGTSHSLSPNGKESLLTVSHIGSDTPETSDIPSTPMGAPCDFPWIK